MTLPSDRGKVNAMYPGIDGFLGTRASLMLDVVLLAMVAVLPVLLWSIWLVKYRRRFQIHKTVQLVLGATLAVTVTLFELDMRINGWMPRAEASPYFGTEDSMGGLFYALYVHLFFAVTTVLLWIVVIVRAVRRFPKPPAPNEHSASHIRLARLAAIDMCLTSVTGWTFYWLAFVA